MPIEFRAPPPPRLSLVAADEPAGPTARHWITYGPHPSGKPTERGIYLTLADAPAPRAGCQEWQPYDSRVQYSGFDSRWLDIVRPGTVGYRTTKVVVP